MKKPSLIYLMDLTYVLTIKELKSKYKSTTLGFLWMIVNPLIQMIVLTIVFSYIIKIKIENYPLFIFSGLLPWMFFSVSIQSATSSLVANRDLIRKVAFPTYLLPISSVCAHLITFLLALIPFVIFLLVTTGFHIQFIFLPLIIIIQTIFTISISLILSSLDIYYRDVSFLLQAILLVWFYVTPIFYSVQYVPQQFLFLYNFNPMVGIITSYQSLFLNNITFPMISFVISSLETIVLLVIGIFLFKNRSPYFADWV